jgi:hypothetical protein
MPLAGGVFSCGQLKSGLQEEIIRLYGSTSKAFGLIKRGNV